MKLTVEKVLANTDRSSGCWEWLGGRSSWNYGNIRQGMQQVRAHRFVYAEIIGPIPKGMNVCHRCDNPPCIRPDHLFLGTPAENMQDRKGKGHYHRDFGKGSGGVKLRSADVARLVAEYRPVRGARVALARKYGITKTTVLRLLTEAGIPAVQPQVHRPRGLVK